MADGENGARNERLRVSANSVKEGKRTAEPAIRNQAEWKRNFFLSCYDIKALITTYLRHLICWYFSAPPFRPLQSRTVQQRLWRHGSSVYWFLWFCDVIFYGHSSLASLFVLRRLGTCKVSLGLSYGLFTITSKLRPQEIIFTLRREEKSIN